MDRETATANVNVSAERALKLQERVENSFLVLYAILLCIITLTVYLPQSQRISQHKLLVNGVENNVQLIDIVNFYEAGSLASNSETRLHVYDPTVQSHWQTEFLKPQTCKEIFFARAVPFFFWMMIPLSQLPLDTAYLVWTWLSIMSAIIAVILLGSLTKISMRLQMLYLIALFTSLPCVNCILVGQLALFLLLGLAVFCWGFFSENELVAGVALALLSVKPHYALYLLIPAIVKKRWWLMGIALLVELCLWLLAADSIGWRNVLDYPAIIAHSETARNLSGLNPAEETCIRGLLSQVLPQSIAFPASIAAWVIGLITTALLWLKARDSVRMQWAMALTIGLFLALSPHTNVYDLSLLLVPGMVAASSAYGKSSYFWWQLLLASYPLLTWLLYIPGMVMGSTSLSMLAVSFPQYCLLMLAFLLYRDAAKAL